MDDAAVTPLVIVEPRDSWADDFRRAAGRLRAAFGPVALRIDHIGSTAVPGLVAKPVIDIQVSVTSLDPAGPLADLLVTAGLTYRPDLDRDHVPEGAVAPHERWCKVYGTTDERTVDGRREPALHVHVRATGSPSERYALLFRDHLRAHPADAATYGLIERELVRLCPGDWDAYYSVKDPVCDLVAGHAETWAAATGWRPGPSDA
jgi:GrpB-like predicted nucleotidyltransferase (UPF0157 family)